MPAWAVLNKTFFVRILFSYSLNIYLVAASKTSFFFAVQGFVTIITSAPIENTGDIKSTELDITFGKDNITNNTYDNTTSGDYNDTLISTNVTSDSSLENLSLEEQTEKVCVNFTLQTAGDYLMRYGYEDREDWKYLSGKRLEFFLAPALKLFQKKMEIDVTGISLIYNNLGREFSLSRNFRAIVVLFKF